MTKKPKDVTDEQFDKLVAMLPRLTLGQLDKLWEKLRLEIRRHYYNQGNEGALKALEKALASVHDADGGVVALKNAIAGVRAKLWAHKDSAKKPAKKKAPAKDAKAAG